MRTTASAGAMVAAKVACKRGMLISLLTPLLTRLLAPMLAPLQEALDAGCRQVCPRANALSAAAVQRAVAAGLSVRAWGLKSLAVGD